MRYDPHWVLDSFKPNYLAWARKHYGRALPMSAINALWAHQPITPELVGELALGADWRLVSREAAALKWKVKSRGNPREDLRP